MTKEEAIKRIKQHISEAEYHLRLTRVLSSIEDELLDIRAFTMAIEALEGAPPKGHWLNKDGKPTEDQYAVHCSECTNWSEYASNFCMNCGADMRGEGDDK